MVSELMKDIYAVFRKHFSALDRIQCKSNLDESQNIPAYQIAAVVHTFLEVRTSGYIHSTAQHSSAHSVSLFSFVRKVGIFILIGPLTTRQGVRCKLRYS